MDDLVPSTQECLGRIRELLTRGRRQALQAVNAAMVQTYWHIGREIVEEEQRGSDRAEYGARLVETLARRLTDEFGKGFAARSLWYMRDVYLAFPILNALRSELSWTHYRLLTRVQNTLARRFYEAECANARWSTRELERQISTLLYERLALSRDAVGRQALPQNGHEILQPEDLIKDPVVLVYRPARSVTHPGTGPRKGAHESPSEISTGVGRGLRLYGARRERPAPRRAGFGPYAARPVHCAASVEPGPMRRRNPTSSREIRVVAVK